MTGGRIPRHKYLWRCQHRQLKVWEDCCVKGQGYSFPPRSPGRYNLKIKDVHGFDVNTQLPPLWCAQNLSWTRALKLGFTGISGYETRRYQLISTSHNDQDDNSGVSLHLYSGGAMFESLTEQRLICFFVDFLSPLRQMSVSIMPWLLPFKYIPLIIIHQ
jgi:hypothetical protein